MYKPSYKLIRQPKGCIDEPPVLIFNGQGDLHIPLTFFGERLFNMVSLSTFSSYLYSILPFFSFMDIKADNKEKKVSWDSEPELVRYMVAQYLSEVLNCLIQTHKAGFKWVNTTSRSHSTYRIFLAAILLFYEVMKEEGKYKYHNPMIDEWSRSLIVAERASLRRTTRMPERSGVVTIQPKQRLSESYFKIRDQEWFPEIISDPNLPKMVFEAGEKANWSLREQIVARMLFETGARISEITGLTVHNWVIHGALDYAVTINKGDGNKPTKFIDFSQDTAKLLRRYVNVDRKKLDPQGHSLSDFEELLMKGQKDALQIPLFLTQQRTKLTSENFRNTYWNPALNAQGLRVNIHQARHWYVSTMCKIIIEETIHDPVATDRRLRILTTNMKWRTGEKMLKVYNHSAKIGELDAAQSQVYRIVSGHQEEEATITSGDINSLPEPRKIDGPRPVITILKTRTNTEQNDVDTLYDKLIQGEDV